MTPTAPLDLDALILRVGSHLEPKYPLDDAPIDTPEQAAGVGF